MHFNKKSAIAVFIFTVLTIQFQSCSEDDIVTPPSVHTDAEGILIMNESFTDTVLYVFRGQFKSGFDTLKVPFGTISPHWEIFFINKDTNKIDPPAGADYSPGFTIGNSSIAQIFQDDPINEKWAFHLRGISTGNTTLVIKINHAGHSDFTTPLIPVVVDPNIIGEAVGMKIYFEGNGELIFRDSSGLISGTGFSLNTGDTTEHAVVKFFDKSGSLFTPPYPQYDINGVIGNTATAGFINEAPSEPFVIRIRGISPGNTNLILDLIQGAGTIYNSRPVPVNILP
ncbi:MAG TPA: hypothetical protein PK536_04460 [Ignavibacteria bacterium]|nr:hypothetical protein [Bacteroidota bacterium]HRI84681.1 hypothetical protein [Ignavibacteria bacterium]HRK00230.1 hypothetical protein [Ignavibacteria bacterium]